MLAVDLGLDEQDWGPLQLLVMAQLQVSVYRRGNPLPRPPSQGRNPTRRLTYMGKSSCRCLR